MIFSQHLAVSSVFMDFPTEIVPSFETDDDNCVTNMSRLIVDKKDA